MIVPFERLHEIRGSTSMVDGGFDPIHGGHVAYFQAAAALGDPVLCNVSSDEYVAAKHPPLLPQPERGEVLDAMRAIDYVHLSATTTAAVLAEARPLRYVKGADWRGRGLPDAELAICREHAIEVVYVDTVRNSSSAIARRFRG